MKSASSLPMRMLNVLAVPGEVFAEVIAARPSLANWRVPTLLTCLVGVIGFYARPNAPWSTGEPLAGALLVIAATMIGSFWSAVALWLIGRFCLRVRFSFGKALEVAGLAGIVIALGQFATILLALGFGNNARPSLACLAPGLPVQSAIGQALELANFFHLWSAALFCIGLAKLAKVSVKEAAFWVIVYWGMLRLILIIA